MEGTAPHTSFFKGRKQAKCKLRLMQYIQEREIRLDVMYVPGALLQAKEKKENKVNIFDFSPPPPQELRGVFIAARSILILFPTVISLPSFLFFKLHSKNIFSRNLCNSGSLIYYSSSF